MGSKRKNKQEVKIVNVQDLGNGQVQGTLSLPATMGIPSVKDVEFVANALPYFRPMTKLPVEISKYVEARPSAYPGLLTSIPTEIHERMELALNLWKLEPTIGNAIDLYTEFSVAGMENECDNRRRKKEFDKWCRDLDMDQILSHIFLDYYRLGNVTIQQVTKNKDIWPSGYTIYNPLFVYIEGDFELGKPKLVLRLTDSIVNALKASPSLVSTSYGEQDKTRVINDKQVILPQDRVSRILRHSSSYEKYGHSLIFRAFVPVMLKQKLIAVDMSTAEGILTQLITVKLGSDEHPASPEDLRKFAELLSQIGRTGVIFWNHTLQIDMVRPVALETLYQQKYGEVDADIIRAMGVPPELLSAGGSSYASSFITSVVFLNRLEFARNRVKRWLENEYRKIAEAKGWNDYPSVRFDKISLRQDLVTRLLLQEYDRGAISTETLLQELNYDIDIEAERIQKERETYPTLFIPRNLPYYGPDQGRPPGQVDNPYTTRPPQTTEPTGESGPTIKETAQREIEEDYYQDLDRAYTQALMGIVNSLKTKTRDEFLRDLDSFVFALSFTMLSLGKKYLEAKYSSPWITEVTSLDIYSDGLSYVTNWHSIYVDKFIKDIKDAVLEVLETYPEVDKQVYAIAQRFHEESYRLKAFASEGPHYAERKGAIYYNKALGKTKGIWICSFRENTCEWCKSMHLKRFDIDFIPDDHFGGFCTLQFE